MILNLSSYMCQKRPIPASVYKPTKDYYLVVYDQFVIDPRNAQEYITEIIKKKLMLINHLLDKNPTYQYFFENCARGTITLAFRICQFEYGDSMYIAMRKCFIRMKQDIRQLLCTEEPERCLLIQDQQQFDDLINALKTLQLLRELKSSSLNTQRYKKTCENTTVDNILILEQSFLQNVIFLTTKSKIQLKLEEINQECVHNKLYFDLPDIEGVILKFQVDDIIYDVLFESNIYANHKMDLIKNLQNRLNS